MSPTPTLNSTTPPAAHRVLILGANGRFGAAAAAAFAAAGWEVLAQVRRAPATLPAGVRAVTVALDDTAALVRAAADARAVVYAVNPPYTAWRTEALPLARQGMAVARQLGATFMLPGNVYNFGSQMPARLTEDLAQQPDTVKGRIRADLEAEITAAAAQGQRSVIIRAGDFYGGGAGSWLDLVITKSLAKGRLVYPGPLDRPHAWAYLPDLAAAFVAAAARNDLAPATTLHFAGHTLTGAQLLDAIERQARALGVVAGARPLRRGGMPWGVIRIGGLVVPMWRELAEMAYLWQVPHALDGTLMQRTLGRLPSTTVDSALNTALRALGFGPAPAQAQPAAA